MPGNPGLARRERALFGAALALLVSCASPPERLYSLEPLSGGQVSARELDGRSVRQTILISAVSVPILVDRPQLVLRQGAHGVKIDEQERWAAPLKEQLPRLLAAELSALKPGLRFATANSAAISPPSAHLLVDFSNIDFGPDAAVHLNAHWIYRPTVSDRGVIEGDSSADAGANGTAYEAYVDALMRASGALAADLARHLPD